MMDINLLTNPPLIKSEPKINVPFFRPQIGEGEVRAVTAALRSGWLTTGPQVKRFEAEFANAVNAKYAVALNSCTAALHLAIEALDLQPGQAVLVPTMTFAATAEVLLYKNAVPILVDCDPVTGNMDLANAREQLSAIRAGTHPIFDDKSLEVVGLIPVHVGGYMLDMEELSRFASDFGLWIVEDAAHAFPAAWRKNESSRWRMCGENTAVVTCYSFYANKTITTGEGGMAVTDNKIIAERIRLMSLHGLSHDSWGRYSGKGNWDYQIIAPGYKYNMTDIAAALGCYQLSIAEEMRCQREKVARFYLDELSEVAEIGLPVWDADRINSWHLFPIRLKLDEISIDRNQFMERLKAAGVGCSVHWRPLHMHPLYRDRFGWRESDLPGASQLWSTLVSIPLFSAMTFSEMQHVVQTLKGLCNEVSLRRIFLAA
jgi:dTDP-4-amino-4,6-dideoxygalactose transaminase